MINTVKMKKIKKSYVELRGEISGKKKLQQHKFSEFSNHCSAAYYI
jgi:hypothetical protein